MFLSSSFVCGRSVNYHGTGQSVIVKIKCDCKYISHYFQGISRHFTNKQEKTFREAFSHFDVNNDGEVLRCSSVVETKLIQPSVSDRQGGNYSGYEQPRS